MSANWKPTGWKLRGVKGVRCEISHCAPPPKEWFIQFDGTHRALNWESTPEKALATAKRMLSNIEAGRNPYDEVKP